MASLTENPRAYIRARNRRRRRQTVGGEEGTITREEIWQATAGKTGRELKTAIDGLRGRGFDWNDYQTDAIAETFFYTDIGIKMSLAKLPFARVVLNDPSQRLLLKTSRQSIKSTTLMLKIYIRNHRKPNNRSLYVAPTSIQTKDFSMTKINGQLHHNEMLAALTRTHGRAWNVETKEWKNGSVLFLRSTGGHLGAERIRGQVAGDIYKDELQSLDVGDFPVIDSVASTYDGRDGRPLAYFLNAGTPLSHQNPIETEWNRSKGYEWCILCPHCNVFNEPIGDQHIDPDLPFLFCQHCKRDMNRPPLYPDHAPPVTPSGEWVATHKKNPFSGYRYVRLFMPWARWRTPQRDGILDQMEDWPKRRFYNETLGLPYDGGSQVITSEQVKACCSNYRLPTSYTDMIQVGRRYASYPVFGGMDYAQQQDESTPSYTILTVLALIDDRLRFIYGHRFTGLAGNDPDEVLKKVAQAMNAFGIWFLGVDYGGGGFYETKRLMDAFPGRVHSFQYKGQSQGKLHTVYDPAAPKWLVPRTPSLMEFYKAIRLQTMEFPVYEDLEIYAEDFYRQYVEYHERTRAMFIRRMGPDDAAHSLSYAHLCYRLWKAGELGRPDLLAEAQRDFEGMDPSDYMITTEHEHGPPEADFGLTDNF